MLLNERGSRGGIQGNVYLLRFIFFFFSSRLPTMNDHYDLFQFDASFQVETEEFFCEIRGRACAEHVQRVQMLVYF